MFISRENRRFNETAFEILERYVLSSSASWILALWVEMERLKLHGLVVNMEHVHCHNSKALVDQKLASLNRF
jgi:hypothetical protein